MNYTKLRKYYDTENNSGYTEIVKLTVAFVRVVIDKQAKDEISYSRMVELMTKKSIKVITATVFQNQEKKLVVIQCGTVNAVGKN